MEIRSGQKYPAGALSNFAPHPFVIDGVECASMEGFLQSLKSPNPEVQKQICTMVGLAAKRRGNKRWLYLYWQGKKIDRFGEEYQELLDRAYNALAQNEGFRRALLATGDAVLTHSIGRRKEKETILTRSEFCGRLMRIRERLKRKEVAQIIDLGF